MAETINILLGIWQSFVACICIFIAILAGLKYKERKNKVAGYLFVAFFFGALAAVLQAAPTLIEDVFEMYISSSIDWVNTYFIQEFLLHQYAYYFICWCVYFLFLFSLEFLLGESRKYHLVYKIVPMLYVIVLIVYGTIIEPILIPVVYGEVGYVYQDWHLFAYIDLWVGLYVIALMIPTSIATLIMRGKIPKDEPDRKRLLYIFFFALSLMILIVNFVLESFMVNQPNLFSFIAWVFAVTALGSSYMGLYKK